MAYSDTSKTLLFFLGCIPVRTLIVYLTCAAPCNGYKVPVAALLTLIGLGLLWSDTKRRYYGGDGRGFFGSEVYWDNRIHSFFYLSAAVMVALDDKRAWVPLALDVVVAIVTFMMK